MFSPVFTCSPCNCHHGISEADVCITFASVSRSDESTGTNWGPSLSIRKIWLRQLGWWNSHFFGKVIKVMFQTTNQNMYEHVTKISTLRSSTIQSRHQITHLSPAHLPGPHPMPWSRNWCQPPPAPPPPAVWRPSSAVPRCPAGPAARHSTPGNAPTEAGDGAVVEEMETFLMGEWKGG